MDLSSRVWEILAADASTAVLHRGRVFIRAIVFTDYTSNADNFVVQDGNGKTVFSGNGNADLSPVELTSIETPIQGLIVPTLATGRLLIYIM